MACGRSCRVDMDCRGKVGRSSVVVGQGILLAGDKQRPVSIVVGPQSFGRVLKVSLCRSKRHALGKSQLTEEVGLVGR